MAFIIVERGNDLDIGKRFSLGENPILIGRRNTESNPDITLHDEYISRRHAEISFNNNCFQLRDLGSTNGTTIDEVRLASGKYYTLKYDSLIGLGIGDLGARVILRFKESPTVSTTRIEAAKIRENSSISWLRIDESKGEIWVDEKQLILSRKEYDLILCLYKRAGRVCQRDELISDVWPEAVDPGGVSDAAIDQLVHRLRLKIEPDPSQPKRLVIRKGFGYMLL
jgi:hypothetical protein